MYTTVYDLYTNRYIFVYHTNKNQIRMLCRMVDTMVRVPKALQERYEKLEVRDSWKSFPAFVREAVRQSLDKYENQIRDDRG